MPDLLLPSLEIQNFRAFEHLRIERLGRVNLITGKNNVGKSALLEAIYLYANHGTPYLFRELLDARDELQTSPDNTLRANAVRRSPLDPACIRYMFYGRRSITSGIAPIRVGPAGVAEKTLTVALNWLQSVVEQSGEDEPATRRFLPVDVHDLSEHPEARPFLISLMGESRLSRITVDNALLDASRYSVEPQGVVNKYVKTSGLNINQAAALWDDIALTPLEDEVVKALRIVEQSILRVSVIGEREDTRGTQARGPVPIIIAEGSPERLPLRSLGEGINRLFGIALSLVSVQNGVLLLDEPDNGLHYTVLLDVWRLIFELAHRLNIQVFATTHSWDSIQAFQEAAVADDNEEALLIRLNNKNNKLTTTVFGERELAIVTRDQIEVR